jgi:hypothetical protein
VSGELFLGTRLRFRVRRKKVPEIHFSHIKIRKVPGIFLNLNLAILKMRIAVFFPFKFYNSQFFWYNFCRFRDNNDKIDGLLCVS